MFEFEEDSGDDGSGIVYGFTLSSKLLLHDSSGSEPNAELCYIATATYWDSALGGNEVHKHNSEPFLVAHDSGEVPISFEVSVNHEEKCMTYTVLRGGEILHVIHYDIDAMDFGRHTSTVASFRVGGLPYVLTDLDVRDPYNNKLFPVLVEEAIRLPVVDSTDINPVGFLPEIDVSFDRMDSQSEEIITSFLDSCPSMQPRHVLEVCDALYSELAAVDIDISHAIPCVNAAQATTCLNQLQILVQAVEFWHTNYVHANSADKPFCYAEFRAAHSTAIDSLRKAILSHRSLWVRIVLDAVIADAFAAADLDWYGKLGLTQNQNPSHCKDVLAIFIKNWEFELTRTDAALRHTGVGCILQRRLSRSGLPERGVCSRPSTEVLFEATAAFFQPSVFYGRQRG